MRVLIVTPAPAGSRMGNRVTALRWAEHIEDLGHDVEILSEYRGEPADVGVVLHARRGAPSIRRYRRERPDSPLVVVLTGTDLYLDLEGSEEVLRSMELADLLIALHPGAPEDVPPEHRGKVRVVIQSAAPLTLDLRPRDEVFEVSVVGHLRAVKDPFLPALASRLAPASSRLHVVHVGAALSQRMEDRAILEQAENPRYRWIGEVSHVEALRILARSRLLVIPSKLEGCPNVLSEAIAAGVPVLVSRVAGNLGLVGEDYPGSFPVGDVAELATLLLRAETDQAFLGDLRDRVHALGPLVAPARERESLAELLEELTR